MVNNILFDFDGTIFDTVEGITKSVRYALNLRGIDEPLEALRCFAGPPLIDMFMEHNGFSRDEAQAAVYDFRDRYHNEGLSECCVFPGIVDALKALRAAGRKVCIATSKPQVLAEFLLEREGMTDLFDVIHGSGTTVGNDSKADIIRRCMTELGAEVDDCVLVGDTKWDAIGANEVGVKCVGVRWGYAAEGELEAHGVCAIAEDTEALVKLLLTM